MSESTDKVRLITPVFRVSFPHVFTAVLPKNPKPGVEPKFGLMAIFTPSAMSPEDAKLWQDVVALGNRCALEDLGKAFKDFPSTWKRPFRSGSDKIEYGMTAQDVFCNLTSKYKPHVVASDGKTEIVDAVAFYPGCYARASVNAYSYKVEGGIGVAFGLFNVMFVKDGPRLDNRIEAEEDFKNYAVAGASTGSGLTDADLGI